MTTKIISICLLLNTSVLQQHKIFILRKAILKNSIKISALHLKNLPPIPLKQTLSGPCLKERMEIF